MVSSAARTVEGYLDSLPAERRAILSTVRDVVVRNLPDGFRETMDYGMIGYAIPLARYPDTYNGRPLCYAGLAAQKNHCALYLMSAYADDAQADWLKQAFAHAGKKLDMGKSCVRFKSLDDLPLPAIGEFIASTTPDQFIARYEAARAAPRKAPANKKADARRTPAKKKKTLSRRRA
jgi:hypothetical protein